MDINNFDLFDQHPYMIEEPSDDEDMESPEMKAIMTDLIARSKRWRKKVLRNFYKMRKSFAQIRNSKESWPSLLPNPDMGEDDMDLWLDYLRSQTCTLDHLFGMTIDQREIALEVLIYQVMDKLAPGQSIDKHISNWIFGILACIEFPLHFYLCVVLRDLCKTADEVRERLDDLPPNDIVKAGTPLSIITTLVTQYFNHSPVDPLEYDPFHLF